MNCAECRTEKPCLGIKFSFLPKLKLIAVTIFSWALCASHMSTESRSALDHVTSTSEKCISGQHLIFLFPITFISRTKNYQELINLINKLSRCLSFFMLSVALQNEISYLSVHEGDQCQVNIKCCGSDLGEREILWNC